MKRTRVAMVLMLVSFALGLVVALGSLVSTGGHLDSEALRSAPFSATLLLMTFVTPWVVLLEIAAIVLVVLDSRVVGGLHRRLVLVALWFLIVWALANVGGFLPLTFMAIRRESLALLRAGQLVKGLAGLLNYTVPFLLIFGVALGRAREMLLWALALTIIGNFTTVILGGAAMRLVASSGIASPAPTLSVDYSRGVYPVSLALGYAGALLYIGAYATVAMQMRRSGNRPSDAAGV